jgi:hypothetical protein
MGGALDPAHGLGILPQVFSPSYPHNKRANLRLPGRCDRYLAGLFHLDLSRCQIHSHYFAVIAIGHASYLFLFRDFFLQMRNIYEQRVLKRTSGRIMGTFSETSIKRFLSLCRFPEMRPKSLGGPDRRKVCKIKRLRPVLKAKQHSGLNPFIPAHSWAPYRINSFNLDAGIAQQEKPLFTVSHPQVAFL